MKMFDKKTIILNKMQKLKDIVDDESVPMYKREQAAAKYIQMEKKYFPNVI